MQLLLTYLRVKSIIFEFDPISYFQIFGHSNQAYFEFQIFNNPSMIQRTTFSEKICTFQKPNHAYFKFLLFSNPFMIQRTKFSETTFILAT